MIGKKTIQFQQLFTNYIVIDLNIIKDFFDIKEQYAKVILWWMIKEKVVTKIAPKKYIINNSNLKNIPLYIANMIDEESYISLYSVLEKNIIKQSYTKIFSITQKRNYTINHNWQEFVYIKSVIPQNFWIETNVIDNKLVRIADKERALLDLIYIHIFWKQKIHTELYLEKIDKIKIEKYLKNYPQKVIDFYHNKLKEYAK